MNLLLRMLLWRACFANIFCYQKYVNIIKTVNNNSNKISSSYFEFYHIRKNTCNSIHKISCINQFIIYLIQTKTNHTNKKPITTWHIAISIIILLVDEQISWILKMACLTSNGLLVSRALSGFSGAAVYLVVPAYCVEIASPSTRGILGSFLAFGINIGIVTMYVMGAYVSYKNTIIILYMFILLVLALIFMSPESPVFCVKHSKYRVGNFYLYHHIMFI